MLRNERYDFILNHFRNALPNVTTELQFGSAFQLLVATLLSAQCTDKRINMVTRLSLLAIQMHGTWRRRARRISMS